MLSSFTPGAGWQAGRLHAHTLFALLPRAPADGKPTLNEQRQTPNAKRHTRGLCMNQLDALRQFTTVVADTGDFRQLAQFQPQVMFFTGGYLGVPVALAGPH